MPDAQTPDGFPHGLPDGLRVERGDGVLRITFDRPAQLNALTAAMTDATAALLERASADDAVRVVLLTGSGEGPGSAFSTGADIGGADAHLHFDESALVRANRLVRSIVRCDKPVVAAVNGVAAGVGCSTALACDLVVAAGSSAFLLAFARIGLMPDGGASATVAAAVGRARAMRMALLAEPLSAREAYDAGLATHLVPDEELRESVDRLVGRLADGPPLAFTATKRAVNAATLGPVDAPPCGLDAALETERVGQTLLLRTADVAEGMRAFGEKRRPTFRGE
ncbi:enoyl-CoA hydratase-related protein [Nocardioides perillae]|uniref:Enoyl-CoA hydratase n=1 Tax=Nocardioides perillae TaxID=1119534 RepID=A0A7Y9RXM3_9ACTN|nr:enoyl-CoA hydratase-related protein [Nocardioides perillae]NYG56597.1 enoyl-CoA hydratase [Nocardioides perillae]